MRERGQRSLAPVRYRFCVKRDLRREAARINLSQNGLADLCRISSGHMSQLLSGKRGAGPGVRRRIMRVFPSLSFDDLFEEVT